MHSISPIPDFDDDEKVQQYMQDRRVMGVRVLPLSYYPPTHPSQYDPLIQPALLRQEVVSSPAAKRTIATARYTAARILAGQDDRVLVIVGPCSIHSPEQAIEYAKLLKAKMGDWPNLCIVMRAYL